MRKILFTLLALVGTMSMDAQTMMIMKNGQPVRVFTAEEADNVVVEELPAAGTVSNAGTTGTAKRTGDIDVKWVQLWENGPKFAEYNVGATNIMEVGGYYAWGGCQDKVIDPWTGDSDLTGDHDTATKLWGSNWRMPTKEEFQQLLDNCTYSFATTGFAYGFFFFGKVAPYNSNYVFFPAAGYYNYAINDYNTKLYYWSSTHTYWLHIDNETKGVFSRRSTHLRCPVRAVLAE